MTGGLPAGLTARALERTDLQAVFDLERACQDHDHGDVAIDLSDIEAGWRRPDFDLSTMSAGVFDGDAMVGCAEVFRERAEAGVLPSHRGRGIGTWLARTTWDLARANGRSTVGQTVSEAAEDALDLLTTLGYERAHTSWVLRVEPPEEPTGPNLPGTLRFRDFVPSVDDRAVYEVIDTAFNEWPGRESHGFENWREVILARREARPDLVVLIADGEHLVGAAIGFDYGPEEEGWIQQVAVERGARGRGLGRALLQESFRRFWLAGHRAVGLSTDSRTGALGVYLRVGMEVRATYLRMVKDLAPGAPRA